MNGGYLPQVTPGQLKKFRKQRSIRYHKDISSSPVRNVKGLVTGYVHKKRGSNRNKLSVTVISPHKRRGSKRLRRRSLRGGSIEGGYVLYPSSSELEGAKRFLMEHNAQKLMSLPDNVQKAWIKLQAAALYGPSREKAARALSDFASGLSGSAMSLGSSAVQGISTGLSQGAQFVGRQASMAGTALKDFSKKQGQAYSNRNSENGKKVFFKNLCESPYRGARAMSVRYTGLPFETDFDCNDLNQEQRDLYESMVSEVQKINSLGQCNEEFKSCKSVGNAKQVQQKIDDFNKESEQLDLKRAAMSTAMSPPNAFKGPTGAESGINYYYDD